MIFMYDYSYTQVTNTDQLKRFFTAVRNLRPYFVVCACLMIFPLSKFVWILECFFLNAHAHILFFFFASNPNLKESIENSLYTLFSCTFCWDFNFLYSSEWCIFHIFLTFCSTIHSPAISRDSLEFSKEFFAVSCEYDFVSSRFSCCQ